MNVGKGAAADSELDAPIADLVEGCDFLGDAHGVGQRQQQHSRADANVLRPGRNGAQDGYGAGQHPGRVEMVLGHPHGMHAKVFCLVD